jgi:prepilin-type N-terminal cleavage/methylation domain-containing protein
MNILKIKQKKIRLLPGSVFCTRKTTTGFTLIELLVVISIISFLSSIVLASMQTARDKAITAKIAEDMRQVKIASEMYYGDTGSYTFTFASNNINKDILANNNNNTPILQDFNVFSTKIANAQAIPPACDLFNKIGNNLVAAKYLSAVPKHPRENYSKEICYKAATSSDGTYFAAYGEAPETVLIGGFSTPKNYGFVVGDISIPKLNKIRLDTGYKFLKNSTGTTADITSTADIADAVIGVTNGARGSFAGSGGSTPSPITYTLEIIPNGATTFKIDGVLTSDFSPRTYPAGTVVELLAYVDDGEASNWHHGGCDNGVEGQGEGASCIVTMNSSKDMSPVFIYHSLEVINQSLGAPGKIEGTVDCLWNTCSSNQLKGKTITLTAIPGPGTAFISWTGACSGSGLTCSFTMNGDKTVTAMFGGSGMYDPGGGY